MSALAAVLGAFLAGAPAPEGPADLQPVRLYLAGQRAEALGALASRGSLDMRRELGQLFKLRTVKEPAAEGQPGWHRLELRLKNASGDVQARPGYWAR